MEGLIKRDGLHLRLDGVQTSELTMRAVSEKSKKGEMIVRIDESVEDEEWVVKK